VGDYGMMFLTGTAPPGYEIPSYPTAGNNIFSFTTAGSITGNSSTVTLSNPGTATAGIKVANAGVYQITWGLAMATSGSTTPVPAFYANLSVNQNKITDTYTTISCDTGATLNLLQSQTTIYSLSAGDVVSIVNGTGSTFYVNSLNGNGGPVAYITLFRLQ